MDDSLKCSVHFYTLAQMGYEESNSAVTFYHDRTHFDSNKRNQYAQFAEEFSLQQGRQFVLHNRVATTPSKMSRLKDNVKELDQILSEATTNVLKLMWLSPTRPLVCFNNSTIVWLMIEPTSGDLLKVCTDTSLKDVKLSGKQLSDLELVIGSVPMMVVVYTDHSKVDFIGFGKKDLFDAYLSLRHASPEKLSVFEPFLMRSLELQCPSTLLVDKWLLFCPSKQGSSNLFVCVRITFVDL